MPETQTENQTEDKKTVENIVTVGKPERVSMVNKISEETVVDNSAAAAEIKKPDNGADKNKPEDKTEQQKELSDDELKKVLEGKGIKFDGGFDELLKKISAPAEAATETAEQKTTKELAKEKKILDLFIENGGTAEQFVAIKNIAKGDVTELSVAETKAELKAAGFNEEEITKIIKDRYFQFDEEEMEQYDDETDREYKNRLKEYGAKKLANRSLYKKQQAEQVLSGLQKAIENSDLQVQYEAKFQSNVDESLKSLPRKVTFELGKIDDKDIPPIEHEVSEESITKVSALLKDPVERNNFFYTKDGSLNLSNISELMVRNEELQRALRGALLEGQSRQVKIFEATFPARNARDVGVGGAPYKNTDQTNRPVTYGKPQRA